MRTGNDGFTDCDYVCNPDNGMAWSCQEYCPDFKFVATTLTTLTTDDPGTIDTYENEQILTQVVVFSCIAVLFITVFIIVCCHNKRQLVTCFSKCRAKRLLQSSHAQTPATDEELEPGRFDACEDATALLRVENESIRNSKNTSQSIYNNSSTIKNAVNLPHVTNMKRPVIRGEESGVQAVTQARNHHENQLDFITEHTNHFSQDETDLKDVGERADLAIGQSSASSFGKTIIAVEPKTVTNYVPDNNHESDENAITYDQTTETNTGEDEQLEVSFENGRVNLADIDIEGNGAVTDYHDNDISSCNDDVHNGDDDKTNCDYHNDDSNGDDDNDDDDDDDDEIDDRDEGDSAKNLELENTVLLKNKTNDSGFTSRTENTLSNEIGVIVPVTEEDNFRTV